MDLQESSESQIPQNQLDVPPAQNVNAAPVVQHVHRLQEGKTYESKEQWHREQLSLMSQTQRAYYEKMEEAIQPMLRSEYQKDPEGWKYHYVFDGLNNALQPIGFSRRTLNDKFDLQANRSSFWYHPNASRKFTRNPPKEKGNNWRKVNKWTARQEEQVLFQATKRKVTTNDRRNQAINRQRRNFDQFQPEDPAINTQRKQKTGKIEITSNQRLFDFNARAAQRDNEFLQQVEIDYQDLARQAVKKIKTLIFAAVTDTREYQEEIQNHPGKYDAAAAQLVRKNMDQTPQLFNDFQELIKNSNGVLPSTDQMTPEFIDEIEKRIVDPSINYLDDSWVTQTDVPFWANHKKWTFWMCGKGNRNHLRKHLAHHVQSTMLEMGLWSLATQTIQQRKEWLLQLRRCNLPSFILDKNSRHRAFLYLVDWERMFNRDTLVMCPDCRQPQSIANAFNGRMQLPHCQQKWGNDQVPIRCMVADPVPACPLCNWVFGFKDEDFYAWLFHAVEFHVGHQDIMPISGTPGHAYYKAISVGVKRKDFSANHDNMVLSAMRETFQLKSETFRKMPYQLCQLPQENSPLRELCETSPNYVTGQAFFYKPSNDIEWAMSTYLPRGKQLTIRAQVAEKFPLSEKLTQIILRSCMHRFETEKSGKKLIFAKMKFWIYDYKELIYQLQFENLGESISHYLQTPYRAVSIDMSLKMVGQTVRDLCYNISYRWGMIMKSWDIKMIFQTLSKEHLRFCDTVVIDEGQCYTMNPNQFLPLPSRCKYSAKKYDNSTGYDLETHTCYSIVKLILAWMDPSLQLVDSDIQEFWDHNDKGNSWLLKMCLKKGYTWRMQLKFYQDFAATEDTLRGLKFDWNDIAQLFKHRPAHQSMTIHYQGQRLPQMFFNTDFFYQTHQHIDINWIHKNYALDVRIKPLEQITNLNVERAQRVTLIKLCGVQGVLPPQEPLTLGLLVNRLLVQITGLTVTQGRSHDEDLHRTTALVCAYILRVFTNKFIRLCFPRGDETNRAEYYMYIGNCFAEAFEIHDSTNWNPTDSMKRAAEFCEWTTFQEFEAIVTHIFPDIDGNAKNRTPLVNNSQGALRRLSDMRFGIHCASNSRVWLSHLKNLTEDEKAADVLRAPDMVEVIEIGDSDSNDETLKIQEPLAPIDNETKENGWDFVFNVDPWEIEPEAESLALILAKYGILFDNHKKVKPYEDAATLIQGIGYVDRTLNKTLDDEEFADETLFHTLCDHADAVADTFQNVHINLHEQHEEDYELYIYNHVQASKCDYDALRVYGECKPTADKSLFKYTVVSGMQDPILIMDLKKFKELYLAIGLPGPWEAFDRLSSQVKEYVGMMPRFKDVQQIYFGFEDELQDYTLLPTILTLRRNQFHLTENTPRVNNEDLVAFELGVKRLQGAMLNTYYYHWGDVDFNDWSDVDVREVLRLQIAAANNQMFMLQYRDLPPLTHETQYYWILWPKKLVYRGVNVPVHETPIGPDLKVTVYCNKTNALKDQEGWSKDGWVNKQDIPDYFDYTKTLENAQIIADFPKQKRIWEGSCNQAPPVLQPFCIFDDLQRSLQSTEIWDFYRRRLNLSKKKKQISQVQKKINRDQGKDEGGVVYNMFANNNPSFKMQNQDEFTASFNSPVKLTQAEQDFEQCLQDWFDIQHKKVTGVEAVSKVERIFTVCEQYPFDASFGNLCKEVQCKRPYAYLMWTSKYKR